ncbi:MAG: hypothetical protein LBS69_08520 [Prevotellaceae bacterium]|jgi:hypothetical protein|nr:hypothetical protein [Prevotellaceae bacterium]
MAKKFQGKIEDVPVLGEFLLSNVKKDINDFRSFSSVFTPDYLTGIETKINLCKELISSSSVTKELKTVTRQLYSKSKGLRVKLNVLEGYLKLGANDLDVTVEDAGLKNVRNDITRCNTEGLASNMQKVITVVKRNQPALEAKGLRPEMISDIESQIGEISALNVKQNDLISKRNRLTKQNIELFNDLWESLQPVVKTAKAIYRGVDDVKLKDYTIAQLLKRINATRKKEKDEQSI